VVGELSIAARGAAHQRRGDEKQSTEPHADGGAASTSHTRWRGFGKSPKREREGEARELAAAPKERSDKSSLTSGETLETQEKTRVGGGDREISKSYQQEGFGGRRKLF